MSKPQVPSIPTVPTPPVFRYKNILWLCPPNFAGGLQYSVERELELAGLNSANIRIRNLCPWGLKRIGKNKFSFDGSKSQLFSKYIQKFKPDFIVCNDKASLGHLTSKYISLNQTRGSIYHYQPSLAYPKIPVLVIDDIKNTKLTKTGTWIFKQDIQKLKRWLLTTQRHQVKFSYTVCESKKDLDALMVSATISKLISIDIETSGNGKNVKISCVGYTCLLHNGNMHTWVIPFIDLTQSDGCYWRNIKDEEFAQETMRFVNTSRAVKVMQNGQYDASHFLTYHAPCRNYLLDTLHLFHSIYIEAPKRLDFITSLTQDFYRYWKDESAEDGKEDSKLTKLPTTAKGFRDYWRYNALDCYYTMVDSLFLLKFIQQPQMEWAWKNYLQEFALQMGPALASSMRGIKWNPGIQAKLNTSLLQESSTALEDLKLMTGDPNFNPNSVPQVKQLVYDILKATPLPRKKGKTGEKILQLIQTQHPLFRRILDQIWKVKKPANNASKYGTLQLLNSRFMYKASAAGTETGRQATAKSHFWVGGNVQNIPDPMRIMFEPDPGYYLWDFDYSQSDAYFTAFETQDPDFIKTMLSDKDTHCIHAEHFFKIPYDKLIAAKKLHEEWCTHKITGVRSITKSAVYGSNYYMGGYTLFITMGQEAVIAAGIHLGYKDAGSWNLQQLVVLCTKMIESYFQMYPEIPLWSDEEILKVSSNHNLATCYGGLTRLFFSNLRTDQDAKREFAAFYGQGGSAGNINEFLKDFYYGTYTDHLDRSNESSYDPSYVPISDSQDVMVLFQVHDSVVGQVKKDKLHLLPKLKRQMERECEIKGRKFVVPVEGSIGLGWGKRQLDWHADIKGEEIEQFDREWWRKFRS